jgi:hypothetical protein
LRDGGGRRRILDARGACLLKSEVSNARRIVKRAA